MFQVQTVALGHLLYVVEKGHTTATFSVACCLDVVPSWELGYL